MPELPIYPQKREAPGYALERRLNRLLESGALPSLDALYRETGIETLRLTGASPDRDAAGRHELLDKQLEALSAIETAASRRDTPDLDLVRDVHRHANPGAEGTFRSGEAKPRFRNARPSPPRFVQSKLENLLDWLSAESGREMFPAERMALWFARFVEIAPFEQRNFRTAHLLVSFFARTAGYPPVSLRFEEAESVRAEIEAAMAFDTAPLVTRFNDALSRALDACEEDSRRGS